MAQSSTAPLSSQVNSEGVKATAQDRQPFEGSQVTCKGIEATAQGLTELYVLTSKLEWSYVHGASATALRGETVGQILEKSVSDYPDKEAVVFCRHGLRLTYQQFFEKSNQLAAGFTALGLKRGDRVGIWSPNRIEWVLTQFATAQAGIIMVNVNPAYQVGEAEYALRQVGIKALICPEEFKTQRFYEMIQEICPELGSCVPGDLNSRRLPELKTVIMQSEKSFPGAMRFSDVMDAGTNEHKRYILDLQRHLQSDDPINIQFTSGTTGSPKGATLTHHNVVNNAYFVGHNLDYHKQETRICVSVPFYHCFGMGMGNLCGIIHGATCVYPAPSFEPEASLQAIHDERCTSVYGTPTMFIDMLNSPNINKYDLSCLHTGIMAGSPCPAELMKQTIEKMHTEKLTIAFGTTENSPVTFQTSLNDTIDRRVKTIGKVMPHTEAKIIDPEGNVVRVNTQGEICIRGYSVMRGYWGDEGQTREAITEDRWYHTGDIGSLDEDGYCHIHGRIRDMIIRGGENVYPVDIEQYLHAHPKIADVQVIGVADARLGEVACAWVLLHDGQSATPQEIKDFCKGKIAHFKIPKYVLFVKEFPMTVTGKVQKFHMQEQTPALLEAAKNC